jgi:hypothetical protein
MVMWWSSFPPMAIYVGARDLGGKHRRETGEKWWPAREKRAENSGAGTATVAIRRSLSSTGLH